MSAISISRWLDISKVALDLEYAIELVEDYKDKIKEVKIIDDGEIYILYEGLDNLFIYESLVCAIGDNRDDVIIGRNHYVYIMRCYNYRDQYIGVCKVGVSRFPEKRAEDLTEAWSRKKLRFRVDTVSRGYWSRRKMYSLESSIHTVLRFKGMSYDSGCKYDGFSELFIVSSEELEMLRWLLKK